MNLQTNKQYIFHLKKYVQTPSTPSFHDRFTLLINQNVRHDMIKVMKIIWC